MATEKAKTAEDRLTALENKITEQDKTIRQQDKTISELSQQLGKATDPAKSAEKPKIPKQEFQVGDDTYKFAVPVFSYKGEKVTALDALADPDILADLVQKKSGVIRQVFK